MKIIDFHTHFFPNDLAPRAIQKLIDNAAKTVDMKNYTDGTIDGLTASMKTAGIDTSVTLAVATKPTQVRTIHIGCIENSYDGIVQFGSLHPNMENFEAEIDFLKANGVKGIKMHPEYQDFYVSDKKYYPMYEKLAEANLIVVFHAGKDPGPFTNDHVLPPALRKVNDDIPALKIVAAHLGGWMVWDDVEKELAGREIYFDTSAIYGLIDPAQFLRICRKHGCEKILFGSDSPWYDQRDSVEWIKRSGLTDVELENIFSKNATALLSSGNV